MQADPKRVKKALPKILKTMKPEDRVMIVGVTRSPYGESLPILSCIAYCGCNDHAPRCRGERSVWDLPAYPTCAQTRLCLQSHPVETDDLQGDHHHSDTGL